MQPRDFSDFADQLNLQQGLHCEALYRTATGRWYYSLYNEVKSWSGEVKIIPFQQGYSTTNLINKITS